MLLSFGKDNRRTTLSKFGTSAQFLIPQNSSRFCKIPQPVCKLIPKIIATSSTRSVRHSGGSGLLFLFMGVPPSFLQANYVQNIVRCFRIIKRLLLALKFICFAISIVMDVVYKMAISFFYFCQAFTGGLVCFFDFAGKNTYNQKTQKNENLSVSRKL